jgi:hypothetical protein
MSALPVEDSHRELSRRPIYQSDIRYCQEEPLYWLSLYKKGDRWSTTGQCFYHEAYRHALLWVSIKDAGRTYKIMHEADGFQVEETSHTITQICQHPDCRFVSSHSYYVVDGERLRSERLNHLARHNRTGQRNFKRIFIAMLFVLSLAIFGILKGWF